MEGTKLESEFSRDNFVQVIKNGEIEAIESYVKKSITWLMGSLNDKGDTALLCAAKAKQYNVVIKLLELGADPNDKNHHLSHVLHYLALNGANDCINYFIENHPVVFRNNLLNRANKNYDTPLHAALMKKNRKKTVMLLLDQGASPLALSSQYRNILHFAVIRGYKDLVEQYIDDDRIDWTLGDYNDLTILHYAAKLQDTSILKFLLSLEKIKTLKERKDFFGRTPLQVAIEKKNDNAIVLLGGNLEVIKQSKEYGFKRPVMKQSHIMPQCLEYFKQAQLDTSSYDDRGHCQGIESHAGCVAAHFSLDIFYKRLNAISLWDRTPEGLKLTNKLLDASDIFNNAADVFEYTGKEVFFYQTLPLSYSGSRKFTGKYQFRKKTTSDTATFTTLFEVPPKKKSILASYTTDVFTEYMTILQKMPGKLQIELHGLPHATRLFIENNSIRYLEPNAKYEFAPFASINKVIDCIRRYKFQLLGRDPWKSYICFTVYAVHNLPSKPVFDFNYFPQDKLPKNRDEDIAFQNKSPHNLTFLHFAVYTNSLDTFRELLKKSFIDPFKKNSAGESAIDWVVNFDHSCCFEGLAKNIHKKYLRRLIKQFIDQGNLEALKPIFLLRQIPHKLYIRKETILTYAMNKISSRVKAIDQIILFLIKNNFALELYNKKKKHPLFIAIQKEIDNSITMKLLMHTKNIHVLNSQNQILLHCAASVNNLNIVKWLLNNKIDVNHQDSRGRTVLHHLVTKFWWPFQINKTNEIIHEIINTPGIDINKVNRNGMTAFDELCYKCSWSNMTAFLTTFLKCGATVSSTAQTLYNIPLVFAMIKDRQWDLLEKCLQQSGFDIITPSHRGAYPIHYLAGFFCEETRAIAEQFLVKVDIHCKTETGLSALDVAVLNTNQLAIAYFIEKGLTKLHEQAQKEISQWMSKGENNDIIKLLKEKNIRLSPVVTIANSKNTLYRENRQQVSPLQETNIPVTKNTLT